MDIEVTLCPWKIEEAGAFVFLWEGTGLFVMQLRPRKWYGVGFGSFDMVLDKILVCGLKQSSDCKLQEFIIFSGLQKWSKNEILWDKWCLKKHRN